MIEDYSGDIFTAPIDILVHQANCFCTMGAGIAAKVREFFPEAYEADCETKKGDRSKLGTASYARIHNSHFNIRHVFNLYGQYNYGRDKRYTDYEAYYNGLEFIRGKITNTRLVVGIPKFMGCNLSGGNWRICETIIQEIFGESVLRVLICHYSK